MGVTKPCVAATNNVYDEQKTYIMYFSISERLPTKYKIESDRPMEVCTLISQDERKVDLLV